MEIDLIDCFNTLLLLLLTLHRLFIECVHSAISYIRSLLLPEYKDLTNDVIVITGAAGGLGRQLCLEFLNYSKTIIGLDIDEPGLSQLSDLVFNKFGFRIKTYVCDLRDKKNIDNVAELILSEFGKVSILVNNAGVTNHELVVDLSQKMIEDCFKVNVLSQLYLIQAFLPSMLGWVHKSKAYTHAPRGNIVSILSIAAQVPAIGLSEYCASKAAASLLNSSLELELHKMGVVDDVRITRVYPFYLDTKLFEGIQLPHPLLLPMIDPAYCAQQTVEAVRLNKRCIYVKGYFRFLPIIQSLLPLRCLDVLYKFCGVYKMIDNLKEARSNQKAKVT